MILAIDPGIRGCGVALFEQRTSRLFRAAYIESLAKKGNMTAEAVIMAKEVRRWAAFANVDVIAAEWPKVYASRIRAGDMDGQDPNDLIALSAVDAALAAMLDRPVHSYYPSDWKGQMTKGACQQRIEKRLDGEEMVELIKGTTAAGRGKAHNVWDAVGIGLHHMGRFERQRVIPT